MSKMVSLNGSIRGSSSLAAAIAAVSLLAISLVLMPAGFAASGYTTPTCTSPNGSVNITLIAEEVNVVVANNVTYHAWTFNGTVPGPTIWVNQCENVHFTFINNDQLMAHAIDFHAAEVNWATVYQPVAPGKSITFDFTPAYPGIFMYHCGMPPVLQHIGNGMYGAIIVQPTTPLPKATGGQYVLVESEFYVSQTKNTDGSYSGDYTKMLAATPDYVVFNGKAFQYQASPLKVNPNQLVRLYLLNVGPDGWEAFHVIGAIMDTVYIDGNPENVQHGLQTLNIPPSGGAIVDMYFRDHGGKNPFVNHDFAYAQKGAVGVFQVSAATPATQSTSVAGATSSVTISTAAASTSQKLETTPVAQYSTYGVSILGIATLAGIAILLGGPPSRTK